MAFPDDLLVDGEQLLYIERPHWLRLLGAGGLLAGAVIWIVLVPLTWITAAARADPISPEALIIVDGVLLFAVLGLTWLALEETGRFLTVAGSVTPLVIGGSALAAITTPLQLVMPISIVAVPYLLMALVRFIRWRVSRHIITTDRLIIRAARIIRRIVVDMRLSTITDVELDQGILARIARSGDLWIETSGPGPMVHLPWVVEAEQARRLLYQRRTRGAGVG